MLNSYVVKYSNFYLYLCCFDPISLDSFFHGCILHSVVFRSHSIAIQTSIPIFVVFMPFPPSSSVFCIQWSLDIILLFIQTSVLIFVVFILKFKPVCSLVFVKCMVFKYLLHYSDQYLHLYYFCPNVSADLFFSLPLVYILASAG